MFVESIVELWLRKLRNQTGVRLATSDWRIFTAVGMPLT